MSKSFYVSKLVIRLSVVLVITGALTLVYSQAQIPNITWTERSNWVNVKTDVLPAAVGNGIADDGPAIQKALDSIGWSPTVSAARNKVCYLPPGTYRITKPLLLNNRIGGMVVGHGRTTIIRWDGQTATGNYQTEIPMLWSKGAYATGYYGITWDGNNKAGVGFDHATYGDSTQFECQVRHENCAFINFPGGTGLRLMMGQCGTHTGGMATSETQIRNCLFKNCMTGVIVNCNDYLNICIEGCEFSGCGNGVFNILGACYVRNCHFENSTTCDINGVTLALRCTSTGSAMFYKQSDLDNMRPWIQNCSVSGWTNLNGAINLFTKDVGASYADNSPALVFDNIFSNPPNKYPPIRIDQYGLLEVVLSNNTYPPVGTTDSLIFIGSTARARTKSFHQIPYTTGVNRCTPNLASTQSFLKSTLPAQGQIFDADKGYNGNVQACINAAIVAGNGAVAYFPSTRQYTVTAPVIIGGSNYSIEGDGERSNIAWLQSATLDSNQILFDIRNPHHITIKNISINNNGGDASTGQGVFKGSRIKQTNTNGTASFITYDRVWMYGYSPSKGLVLSGLTSLDTVHIIRIEQSDSCRFIADNCSRATIFADFIDGPFIIKGSTYPKTGFFGVNHINSIGGGIWVHNNQNAIVGTFYTEQATNQKVWLTGGAGDPTDGRVTIGITKFGGWGACNALIQNFTGQCALVGGQYGEGGFIQQGTNPVNIIMLAQKGDGQNTATICKYSAESGATRTVIGCTEQNGTRVSRENSTTQESLTKAAGLLDDFRNLGEKDLLFNYRIMVNTDCTSPIVNPFAVSAPATRRINITGNMVHLPDAQKYSIRIFNANGALVNTISMQGPGNMVLPINKTTGVYMIKVTGDGMQGIVKKIVRLQ